MTFDYICFSVTSLCNMACEYCFRTDAKSPYIALGDFEKSLKTLKALGCHIVNIAGGEPLLTPFWRDYITLAKSMGFTIYLSTNGLGLDLDDPVLNDISILTIPLDSCQLDINMKTRNIEQFNKVSYIINKFKTFNYPFRLKINTVLTKHNYMYLSDFIDLINHPKIIWKMFQYREKGLFNVMSREFAMTDIDAINSIIDVKRHMVSNANCNIMIDDTLMDIISPKPYIMINSDGVIYLATYCTDILIGNICTGRSEDIFNAFSDICPKITKFKYNNEIVREMWKESIL